MAVLALLLTFSRGAFAHPMGNFSVNHYAKVDLGRDRVTIVYFIDLAEIPAFQEMQEGDIQANALDPAVRGYVAKRGVQLGRGLSLTVNGEALPLRMTSSGVVFPAGAGGLPTMKMGFVYEADYPASLARAHVSVHFGDDNYAGHTGWKEIIARASAGSLLSSSVPATDRSEQLSNYPTDLLNSPPQDLEASLVAALPAVGDGPQRSATIDTVREGRPMAPPVPAGSRRESVALHAAARVRGATDAAIGDVSEATSGAAPNKAPAATASGPLFQVRANRQQTPRSKFTELIAAPHLSSWFLLTAALIAVGLGGLHALEPGHGKTVVAAYLVGSRGTAVHAVVLGLIVTLSHTAGVFALGAITLYASRFIVPEQLYPWLGLLSGLTIAGLGGYMALRRLTGTATDHSHLPGESHSHWIFFRGRPSGEQRQRPVSTRPMSVAQLLALGITGGIIPCPAALIVLLSAVALHRIGLGFFLIVAFSCGLATVLVSFGLLMVFARRFMSRLAMDGPMTQRWLPLASSAFITVLGIALAVQAAASIGHHAIVLSQAKIGALLFVTGLGLILGMRHSTDPDHVVAISTIVARQKSIRGAAIIGSVWGIGHTITVFIVGALIILFNVRIPPRVGLSMEFCVAVMLVLLGVLNLSGMMQRITRLFTAAKSEEVNLMRPASSFAWLSQSGAALSEVGIFHCVRPLVIGLVHGLAGSAAVALLVLSTIHDPVWATLYLLIFGGGTMLGMMCMTVAMAAPLRFAGNRSAKLSRWLGTVSGMVSLCFGSFLVFQLGIVGGLFTSHPVWIPR